jgi:hemolysin III
LRKKIRQPFSALSHFAGAAAALPGAFLLMSAGGGTFFHSLSLAVYSASLFVMFTASGVYHAVFAAPRTLEILRKIDHAAIYLLIAGTYTPFCVLAFSGFWQWGMLAVIWGLALVGIAVKIFIIRAPRWVNAGVYIIMGWLSLFAAGEIQRQLAPEALGWLVAGGVLYTLGAVVYITRRANFIPGVFGFHEVWHIFVLLAAAAHFAAVASLL